VGRGTVPQRTVPLLTVLRHGSTNPGRCSLLPRRVHPQPGHGVPREKTPSRGGCPWAPTVRSGHAAAESGVQPGDRDRDGDGDEDGDGQGDEDGDGAGDKDEDGDEDEDEDGDGDEDGDEDGNEDGNEDEDGDEDGNGDGNEDGDGGEDEDGIGDEDGDGD